MSRPRVVVLGGGPAGVGAAYRLRELDRAEATVLEQRDRVGGNAASFDFGGMPVDFGSHRLHPACHPEVLADIRRLLGDDLRDRPRHGRIRLCGRWIHYPLRPLDLLTGVDPGFAIGVLGDMLRKPFADGGADGGEESFASVLRSSLGATVCESFYFPYARKIWGLAPEEISAEQARRRVSAASFGKIAKRLVAGLRGERSRKGRFYYPSGGYGQISEAYADAARARGADVRLGTRVTGLERTDDGVWHVRTGGGRDAAALEADHVLSTIPLTALTRILASRAPEAVVRAARGIDFRGICLVYLALDVDRFTEYDAHYFPELDVGLSRLSEPKNYAGREEPRGRTVLCAEVPASPEDDTWSLEDEALARRVAADLERAGIPLPSEPRAVRVVRLTHAYPMYRRGYRESLETVDEWLSGLPGLTTFGRQGLFVHDNTHHALRMAYCAADCLGPQGFDSRKWRGYREEFSTHVVED